MGRYILCRLPSSPACMLCMLLTQPFFPVLQPAECGPCYVFLASQEASYITGSVLHPNGGLFVTS